MLRGVDGLLDSFSFSFQSSSFTHLRRRERVPGLLPAALRCALP
jgi:hypothetical protein